jgi:NAD(P)-dependent dehydrogenase (short-subunit alcohol dehydrogenase family)
VKEIQSLGRKSYGHVADVSKLSEVEELIAASVKNLGDLNVMIANAGIAQVKSLLDLTEDDVRRMFEVNVFGVFNCYSAAAKQMIKQGGGGKIIGAARSVTSCAQSELEFDLLTTPLIQYRSIQALRDALPL